MGRDDDCDAEISDTEALLRRTAAGSEVARGALFEQYRDRLRRMIALRLDKRVAGRVDASDVVQDALRDAHQRLSEYLADPQISFYPWLRRIAWDRLVDAYRTHVEAEKRSVLRERDWSPQLSDHSFDQLAHCLATSTIAPGRRALLAELEFRTKDALSELKPHDREILVLRYLEQLEVPEIAAVLGISQTAVTSRHLRALQRLRRLLGDELGA